MYNIQSHVRQHGGQTLLQRPLDTLDSLALTQLAYMPMEGLMDGEAKATVRELWYHISLTYLDAFPTFYQRKCYFFLQSCAAQQRYGELEILDYQNDIDPDQETQVFRLHICLCLEARAISLFAVPI